MKAREVRVFVLFLLLSVAMTWPVVAHLGSAYAGGRGDLLVHQWTFWWIKQALLAGQNPFFTPLLYTPDGVSLLSHNIAWLNIAFWLPSQAVVGSIAAYNVMFILIFALNGFAMYLFSRDFINHTGAAVVAGVIFGFWPYTMSHYDHPNMILLFALPLAIHYLRRLFLQQQWRYAFLTGLFIALLGISRWQLLLMASPLLLCFGLYLLFTIPEARSKESLIKLAAAGGIAVLLMLPLALPLIQSQIQEDAQDIAMQETNDGRTDLLSYFVPPPIYNAVWDEAVMQANPKLGQAYDLISASTNYMPFIGFTTLLMAVFGVVGRWGPSRFWLAMALLYMLLGLGAQLGFNATIIVSWLPYDLIKDSVVGDFIRRPHRFNVILALPLGMLAGMGTAVLLDKLPTSMRKRRHWVITAVVLIILLLFAENRLFGRSDITPYTVPAWYQTIADDGEQYGILDLPTDDRSFDKHYMSYQTTHGKPLAAGHVSRLPAAASGFLRGVPFLAPFLAHELEMDSSIPDIAQQMKLLADGSIRYVVIHKQFVPEGSLDRWRDWFTVRPFYEDDELVVFSTTPRYGVDFDFAHQLTENIGLIRAAIVPNLIVRGNLLKLNTRWGSIDPPGTTHHVCYDLADQAAIVPLGCWPVSSDWPTDQWGASEIVKADYLLAVPEDIETGSYELMVQLADQNEARAGETAVLGTVQIATSPPDAADPIQWQNGMSLVGHTSALEDDTLLLDMYWQSSRKLAGSFVIFAHLIDDAGQLAAQSDSLPHNWTYPTMVWDPEEVVLEQRALPLQDVPSGDYTLMIGLYDQVTGERVKVNDPPSAESETISIFSFTR